MDELDSKIVEVLREKKKIHYLYLAVAVGTSSETARRRASMLALAYPKNFRYQKGTVELLKPFGAENLSPEQRIEALGKTIKSREATIKTQSDLIQKKQEIEDKLRKNHLPHLERAATEGNLKKILEEIEKLKELYGEK